MVYLAVGDGVLITDLAVGAESVTYMYLGGGGGWSLHD